MDGDVALGISPIGTPVRECRRSGIVDRECDSGDTMSRRRGLEMCGVFVVAE